MELRNHYYSGQHSYLKQLGYGLVLFIIVLASGTAGYRIILDCGMVEAFYNTVITVSTVNVGEFGDNPQAKVFTVFVILVGMGNLLFLVSTFAAFFADGEFRRLVRRRRMESIVSKLKNHFIVCGGGDEIGKYVIDELRKTGQKFVLVNEQPLAEIDDEGGEVLAVTGDPSDDKILKEAGIASAAGIITILPEDRDNAFVAISARGLNTDIRIVSRCVDTRSREKLLKAGADAVVSPDLIGALRIASESLRPNAVNFLDNMLRVQSRGTIRFEDVPITEDGPFTGCTILETGIKKKYDLLVVGVKAVDSDVYIYSPPSDYTLVPGTVLVVLGELANINKVKQISQK